MAHPAPPSPVDVLASMYLFKTVPRPALAAFAAKAPLTLLGLGQRVFVQGEPASVAFLVLEGELVAEVESPEGRRKLGTVKSGELVGEQGLFVPGGRRSATVTAVRPSRCLMLEPDMLDELADNPTVVAMEKHLLGTLARRIRHTNQAIQGAWKAGDAKAGATDAAAASSPETRVGALRSWFNGLFGS